MGLDMFLEILGSLEGFAAEFAFVWFPVNMDSNMRGDVVAFDGGGVAVIPLAGQVQVVGTLAAYMSFAEVFLCKQFLPTSDITSLGDHGGFPGGGGKGLCRFSHSRRELRPNGMHRYSSAIGIAPPHH